MRKKLSTVLATLLVITMSFITSCNDDKDEPSGLNLAGTTWEVVSCTKNYVATGKTFTFKKDGTVDLLLYDFTRPEKWSMKDGYLKIIYGAPTPDEYVIGPFTYSEGTATYVFHWVDVDGKWEEDFSYTMVLKKL